MSVVLERLIQPNKTFKQKLTRVLSASFQSKHLQRLSHEDLLFFSGHMDKHFLMLPTVLFQFYFEKMISYSIQNLVTSKADAQ